MGARAADWHLLDHATDPVPSGAVDLDPAILHYKEISSALTTQATLLKKIGDGDETLLKGVSADAMRKRARDSAEAIGKAANRYDQVERALVGYREDLELARSETWRAVSEASEASASKRSAENLPDPLDTRTADAPPPTPTEDRESQARTRALDHAGADLAAAKSRAERAMSALGEAADRTAAAIRHGWDVDGLQSSTHERRIHVLNKVLKKLVEVLGYIGLALAIVGLVVSGVGIIAIIGLGVAAVAVVFNIILAAQGETSWLNVIAGVVGLVLIGFGAIATKVLKAGQAASLKLGSSALGRDISRLYARIGWTRTGRTPGGGSPAALTESRVAALRNFQTFMDGKKVKPAWWDVRNPGYLQGNKDKFTDIAGKWRWDKVLGIDDAMDLNTINRTIFDTFRAGSTGGVPKWLYVGGAAKTWGWTAGVFGGIANPSTNAGDSRTQWSWADAQYSKLTSARPGGPL
ncbi:hypothetical protein [Cryobacterium sp. SO1]|uniref:hypothetical protein n=1 Tax=Cryobacterium sp. SO1 TaxID=1897061 RepID=UPI001022B5A3|nr:hypothetical protein [Cryobacterium sp. SO1]RZI34289.1 hypothetical protein BJQ95_03430 [Cryobacterium sp. SO1]